MKYIFQFLRILGFCLAGELLHWLLPLPVPASIYGLVLLLLALKMGVVKLEQIKETSQKQQFSPCSLFPGRLASWNFGTFWGRFGCRWCLHW